MNTDRKHYIKAICLPFRADVLAKVDGEFTDSVQENIKAFL